jgi:hypothetical protein
MPHAELPKIKEWKLADNYRDFPEGDSKRWSERPSNEEEKIWREAYDSCATCGLDTKAEVRNYNRMFGDADLWCTNCDSRIRVMDFG